MILKQSPYNSIKILYPSQNTQNLDHLILLHLQEGLELGTLLLIALGLNQEIVSIMNKNY